MDTENAFQVLRLDGLRDRQSGRVQEIDTIVDDLIRVTASKLGRKWRQDRDDIRQNLYVWILEKNTDVDLGDMAEEEGQEKYRRLRNTLWWAGENGCKREHRQQKALRDGYSPEDEYFYSVKQLESLLENYFATGIEEKSPVTSENPVRSGADPAEGGGYLASLIDVARGLESMSQEYRDRLSVRLGDLAGYSDGAVAGLSQSEAYRLTGRHPDKIKSLLGETGDAVRHRTQTALRALQKILGGPSPWTRSAA